MGYETGAYIRTAVYVRALDGTLIAQGVIEGLTFEDALMATTAPVQPGHTFRFLLIRHKQVPSGVERFGRVLWTRCLLKHQEQLTAECRVQWVTLGEPEEAESSKSSA